MFRATDMEKYIEVEIPARIDDEWSLTVHAKTFADILRTIEDDTLTLVLEESQDQLTISSLSDTFKIKWIPASEYVAVPDVQSDTHITLDPHQFSQGIAKVEYAVTEKNFSPVLTWVYMRIKQYEDAKKLVFVGTDSFRLAEYKVDVDGATPDTAVIVPKMHINDIKKVIDYAIAKEVQTMSMKSSDNMVSFGFVHEHMTIHCTSLLIQGNFPDYENENIMPTTWNTKILLDASQLEKSIKKIAILTRDINNFINVRGEGDVVYMNSGDTDMWHGKTQLTSLIEWSSFAFGVNGKYIADFLRVVRSDEVIMRVIDAEKPLIFKDKDDEQFTYVVRPLIK